MTFLTTAKALLKRRFPQTQGRARLHPDQFFRENLAALALEYLRDYLRHSPRCEIAMYDQLHGDLIGLRCWFHLSGEEVDEVASGGFSLPQSTYDLLGILGESVIDRTAGHVVFRPPQSTNDDDYMIALCEQSGVGVSLEVFADPVDSSAHCFLFVEVWRTKVRVE